MNKFFIILFMILSFSACLSKEKLSTKPLFSKYTWKNFLKKNKITKKNTCFCGSDLDQFQSTCAKDQLWPIASLTKLFMSYWAIEKLGLNYQFKTYFHFDRENKNVHISGSQDPYFLEEGLFYFMSELNKLGVKEIKTLSFDSNFYYHFSKDSTVIQKKLISYLNTKRWTRLVKEQYKEMQLEYKEILNLTKNLSFKAQVIQTKFKEKPTGVKYVYFSSPLSEYLRILNAYSNNFTSDSLLNYLGGIQEFNNFFNAKFNWKKQSFKFYTGSGLPVKDGSRKDNLASCSQVLQVISKLKEKLNMHALSLPQLLVTPGIDVGTLRERFKKESSFSGSLWGKTGTLDLASSLAGVLYTEKKPLLFAMMSKSVKSRPFKKKEELWINLWAKEKKLLHKDYIPKLFYPFKNSFIVQK